MQMKSDSGPILVEHILINENSNNLELQNTITRFKEF